MASISISAPAKSATTVHCEHDCHLLDTVLCVFTNGCYNTEISYITAALTAQPHKCRTCGCATTEAVIPAFTAGICLVKHNGAENTPALHVRSCTCCKIVACVQAKWRFHVMRAGINDGSMIDARVQASMAVH